MIRMKPMERSKDNYILWLGEKIHSKRRKDYTVIIKILYNTPFFSIVPFDDNRALDGLGLRYSYKSESGAQPPQGDCTVLEVLIALAERMSYVMYDPDIPNEDQIHVWFWRLVENLRLTPDDDYHRLIDKVNCWLNRDYADNGDGGLFPLKDPIEDQRDVELWYQMQAYLTEKMFEN